MFLRLTFITTLMLVASACTSGPVAVGENNGQRTDAEFKQESSSAVPRMVAVHAPYCSVCVRMKPLVESLVTQCDRKGVSVEMVDVSIEENEHLIERYRVVGLPTYLFLDDAGFEVARLVGAQTESTLRQALGALRGEACPGLGRLKKKV